MPVDPKVVGERIQKLRKEKHISQEKLAEDLGVSMNTIAKIECGLRGPSIEFLLELTNYFDTTTDYILLGIPDEGKNQRRKKQIDETIGLIDQAIGNLLEEKERLLQERKQYE